MAALGDNILANFVIMVTGNVDGAVASLATLQGSLEGMQGTATAMTAIGGALTVGVTLPIMAIGAAGVLSEMQIQKFYQILQGGAAGSGQSLGTLEDEWTNLYQQFPQGGDVIANTLLNVSNVMGKTFGENEQQIQSFTASILQLSMITGEDATKMSQAITQAFANWKVPAQDAQADLQYLYEAAENARVSITTLSDQTGQYSQILEGAGFSMKDTIAMLAVMDQQGMDVSKTVTGVGYGMATLAAGGKTIAPVLADISKEMGGVSTSSMSASQEWEGLVKGIQDGTITTGDATAIFGKRYATNIVQAIKDGHLSWQQMEDDANKSTTSINDAAWSSMTFSQKLEVLKHDIELAFAPLGSSILDTLKDFMPVAVALIKDLTDLTTWFNKLPTPIKDVALGMTGLLAATGPVLLVLGSLIKAFITVSAAVTETLIPAFQGLLVKLGLVEGSETTLATETGITSDALVTEGAAGNTAADGLGASELAADGAIGGTGFGMIGLAAAVLAVGAAYESMKWSAQEADAVIKQTNADAAAAVNPNSASTQPSSQPGSTTENTTVPGYGQLNVKAQGGIVKAAGGFVTQGPQLVLAGDNPGGMEAFIPLQGGTVPVTLSSSTQQAGSSPMAFNIRIDNATLTSTKDAQKLGLQIAYSAQRELSRSGYSRGS